MDMTFWKLMILIAIVSFLAFLIITMRLEIAFFGMLAAIIIFAIGWFLGRAATSLILWLLI